MAATVDNEDFLAECEDDSADHDGSSADSDSEPASDHEEEPSAQELEDDLETIMGVEGGNVTSDTLQTEPNSEHMEHANSDQVNNPTTESEWQNAFDQAFGGDDLGSDEYPPTMGAGTQNTFDEDFGGNDLEIDENPATKVLPRTWEEAATIPKKIGGRGRGRKSKSATDGGPQSENTRGGRGRGRGRGSRGGSGVGRGGRKKANGKTADRETEASGVLGVRQNAKNSSKVTKANRGSQKGRGGKVAGKAIEKAASMALDAFAAEPATPAAPPLERTGASAWSEQDLASMLAQANREMDEQRLKTTENQNTAEQSRIESEAEKARSQDDAGITQSENEKENDSLRDLFEDDAPEEGQKSQVADQQDAEGSLLLTTKTTCLIKSPKSR